MACPCQNSSDSGRAGETGCDPALNFEKPIRFRTVCPLLKPTPDGTLMCSVATEEVRPFWGRVVLSVLFAIILLYGTAVMIAFGFLRQVGYPVTVSMIGWPPAWSEIHQAKSQYFLDNAQSAYLKGELAETVMSLSLAYDSDPYNYEAGFFLARLWQAGRPEVSNHLYQELVANHPEHRTQTAQAWLRSLLPRADYIWIERLAASALRFGDDHAAAWLHAMLFADVRTPGESAIAKLLETPETLSPGVETVLRWEEEVRHLPADIARQTLLQEPPEDSPSFVYFYQIRRLLSLGFPVDALDKLNTNESHLTSRDKITLELRAFAEADFQRSYFGLFDKLTRLEPSLAQFEIISAHMVLHPNKELFRRAKNRLVPNHITKLEERLPALLALFFVAGIHDDEAYQNELAVQMREITNSRFVVLDAAIAAMKRTKRSNVGLQTLLPSLQPMSLDMTYALLERFEVVEP